MFGGEGAIMGRSGVSRMGSKFWGQILGMWKSGLWRGIWEMQVLRAIWAYEGSQIWAGYGEANMVSAPKSFIIHIP